MRKYRGIVIRIKRKKIATRRKLGKGDIGEKKEKGENPKRDFLTNLREKSKK